MKELSIEQKAKRFDEVLAMARECITYVPDDAVNKYMLNMFPELKENEDERIRKECISIIDAWDKSCRLEGDYCEAAASCIAWLEKQGEKKPTDEEMKELLRTEYEKGRADAIAETQVAWSEEDKVMLDEIIDFFENGTVKLQHDLSLYASWLKALKQRITNKQ